MAADESVNIETTSTRLVYENQWMRVREDTIRRRDGSIGIYGVVEKPDFVVIVPVEDDGRLHLVEQYRYPGDHASKDWSPGEAYAVGPSS